MRVFIYGPTALDTRQDALCALERVTGNGQTEILRDFEALYTKLRHPGNRRAVAILLCATKAELMEVSSIYHLLSGLRVILLLPDGEEETIAIGHRVFPRFLGSLEADLEGVMEVLARLLRKDGEDGEDDGYRLTGGGLKSAQGGCRTDLKCFGDE